MKIEERVVYKKYYYIKNIKQKFLMMAFCIILLVMLIDLWPSNVGMGIYFLDVGQGDCIIVKDYKYTFMIDGGGDRFMDDDDNIGQRVVFPFLLDQNIKKIDCIFITHVHYDHIKGVIEVLELVDVDTVVLPSVYENYVNAVMFDDKSSNYLSSNGEDIKNNNNEDFVNYLFKGGDELFLLEELIKIVNDLDIKLMFMNEGEVISGKSSMFTCVYPYKEKVYSEHENENSLVLKLELGSVSVLLTGDIEEKGEQWIVSHNDTLKNINILKVPHHGSNSSSTEEFLVKLNPKIAIVSVGENLFGHPSDIVRMRYKNLNIPFYSTKKYGMIEILVKEDYYKIEPYKGGFINESITRTTEN